MSNYTAQQVKELSTKLGIGLHEAKLRLDKLAMLRQVADAKSIDDIKPILYRLIDGL